MSSTDRPAIPTPPQIDSERCASDPVRAVRELVSRRREWFERSLGMGCDAMAINRASSDVMDGAVVALFESVCGGQGDGESAVLALGGYGRREMAPLSDVDLLFLIGSGSRDRAKRITDSILYPFWDSGVDVGGATRTIGDCREIIGKDVRALTAMLDARPLAGSRELGGQLVELLEEHFSDPSERLRFVDRKMRERARRLARFGSSIYLAQPNVKEGEGGLREYHTLQWATRAAMAGPSREEAMLRLLGGRSVAQGVVSSYSFIWSVRHALHLASGSWNDRLADGVQGEVAARLGFVDSGGSADAESLMAQYYMRAEFLHQNCDRALHMLMRELDPPSRFASIILRRRLPGGLIKTEHGTLAVDGDASGLDAGSAMRLFVAARKMGVPVDAVTKRALASNAALREGAGGAEQADAVREIFSDVKNLDRVLGEMHECGALAAAFPEMARLFHSVQRNGFHTYTVGVHSIKTVGEIAALANEKRRTPAAAAFKVVRRPHILALAAFLHDIGKGHGEDHESRGAAVARGIAERLGFDGRDCADVEFLVRSHLLMSTLAFRRDLRDPAMIERFAQSVRSSELLAMLYLITYADLRAVGPNVWSEWKGGLLAELYQRTLEHMSAGGMTPQRRRKEFDRITRAVLQRTGSSCDEKMLRDFLLGMPERYAFSVSPESIAAHFIMSRDLAPVPVATVTREVPDKGCTEFSVVTGDSPGLFAKIAGVLSANGANIVDAQLYTSRDGIAIDVLWVTDSLHRPLDDPQRWSRIRLELAQAVSGERRLSQIVGGRFARGILAWRQERWPVQVTVDNDVSAMHTVVEISAGDRRGLLYTVADTMHELGLSIDVARITTHVDQVTDVFYIRDALGRKIDSRERLDLIKRALVDALKE